MAGKKKSQNINFSNFKRRDYQKINKSYCYVNWNSVLQNNKPSFIAIAAKMTPPPKKKEERKKCFSKKMGHNSSESFSITPKHELELQNNKPSFQ
jgi:hypothetical protein